MATLPLSTNNNNNIHKCLPSQHTKAYIIAYRQKHASLTTTTTRRATTTMTTNNYTIINKHYHAPTKQKHLPANATTTTTKWNSSICKTMTTTTLTKSKWYQQHTQLLLVAYQIKHKHQPAVVNTNNHTQTSNTITQLTTANTQYEFTRGFKQQSIRNNRRSGTQQRKYHHTSFSFLVDNNHRIQFEINLHKPLL